MRRILQLVKRTETIVASGVLAGALAGWFGHYQTAVVPEPVKIPVPVFIQVPIPLGPSSGAAHLRIDMGGPRPSARK